MSGSQGMVLPVDKYCEEILREMSRNQVVLIQAEPGAGKTTRVPVAVAKNRPGGVLVLEPRRLAARLAAGRVASELGEKTGETVGYQIRYDRKVSASTRIRFITEGLFMHLLGSDPLLASFGCVILDEFHERNVHTDLALMLIRRLQRTSRPDLKLIIMSATLPGAPLKKYASPCGFLRVPGQTYPTEIIWEAAGPKGATDQDIIRACRKMATDPRCTGHILVFLTGIGQINRLMAMCGGFPDDRWEILALAADLPPAKQELVFRASSRRKLIFSTNVAETSLTIPGITGVVDPGFAKIAGHAPWSGMPTLEIRPVSRASADQRAGRAGRTAPGLVYRLYSHDNYLRRPAHTPPDIERLDFSEHLLSLTAQGGLSEEEQLDPANRLPWFEMPPDKSMDAATRTLRFLGALDRHGKLLPRGRKMAEIPLHPRLAATVLAGKDSGCESDALLAACLINEGMLLRTGRSKDKGDCDCSYQMNLLKGSPACEDYTLCPEALNPKRRQAVLKAWEMQARQRGLSPVLPGRDTDSALLAACLLRGFPDRVAKRRMIRTRGGQKKKKAREDLYHFCLGRGGFIGEGSVLKNPGYVLVIDAMEHHGKNAALGTTILAGSRLNQDLLFSDPGGLITRTGVKETDKSTGKTESFTNTLYGNICIHSEKNSDEPSWSGEDAGAWVAQNWPAPFPDSSPLDLYHEKVRLIQEYGIPDAPPEFKGEMFRLFCDAISTGFDSPAKLARESLRELILLQLSYGEQEALRTMTPDTLLTTNRHRFKIIYQSNSRPACKGYIQDFFGLTETPSILSGRCPLSLILQAPNQRPCQLTQDLTSFWKTGYPELKKQFERRYPKHHWPEDPSTAAPVLFKKNLPTGKQ